VQTVFQGRHNLPSAAHAGNSPGAAVGHEVGLWDAGPDGVWPKQAEEDEAVVEGEDTCETFSVLPARDLQMTQGTGVRCFQGWP
jgi:hypothetical protein